MRFCRDWSALLSSGAIRTPDYTVLAEYRYRKWFILVINRLVSYLVSAIIYSEELIIFLTYIRFHSIFCKRKKTFEI